MGYFFKSMGIWFVPIMLMTLVTFVMALIQSIRLFFDGARPDRRVEGGIHAIIFWGAVCAATGILGQLSGIYKALNVVARAAEISPQVCAMGLAESYTTTIFGLVVFILSGFTWYGLLARYRKLAASANLQA